MNCKNCKHYNPNVELMRILATSVNPLFADLDEEIDPKLVDLYLNDAWYQETFKDFKVEKQTLGH